MTSLILIGLAALIPGLALVITGIRRHKAQHPKHVAMLIGGMMMTALGLFLTGFVIAYEQTPPLALNSAGATP